MQGIVSQVVELLRGQAVGSAETGDGRATATLACRDLEAGASWVRLQELESWRRQRPPNRHASQRGQGVLWAFPSSCPQLPQVPPITHPHPSGSFPHQKAAEPGPGRHWPQDISLQHRAEAGEAEGWVRTMTPRALLVAHLVRSAAVASLQA